MVVYLAFAELMLFYKRSAWVAQWWNKFLYQNRVLWNSYVQYEFGNHNYNTMCFKRI